MTALGHRRDGAATTRRRSRPLALSILILLAACAPEGSPTTATATGSTEPSPSVPAESTPSPTGDVVPNVLSDPADGGVGITVTLPSTGWIGDAGGWALEYLPDGFDPPAGAGIIAFVVDEEFYVYGDPCDWKDTTPATPATTVSEIVRALANQASRDPSRPETITVGGYTGKRITLRVPDDARFQGGEDVRFTVCDDGRFATLGVAGEHPGLWAQGPGEIDELWVVDVDGRIALLEAGYYPGTPPHVVDEMHAVLDSMRFEP